MKKLIKIALACILSLTLVGCNSEKSPTKGNTEFASFVKKLPQQVMTNNGFNLNYFFYNAEENGFKKESMGIDVASAKEFQDSFKDIKDIQKQLKEFDYDKLSDVQKLDYDVLQGYLNRQLIMEDYASYENSYLGSFVGFQAQLPLLLMEFELNDKKDVEIYLDVLKKAPESFSEMVELEKERQKQGTGMSKKLLDGVIKQANNFAKGDVSFLVDALNTKIEEASFLNDSEKKQAKKDNENYTKNNLIQAYANLAKDLGAINPSQKDGGIYGQKNSQEYYEAMFQNKLGLSWNIKELKAYLDKKEMQLQTEVSKLAMANPNFMTLDFNTINHGDFASIEANVKFLEDEYLKYYPDAGKMSFVAKTVPDSMKDNFSPAAYLASRIDRKDQALMIIVNGKYDSSLFETIAHEGYPGHMYLDCYFQKKKASTFRYLLGCKGYSEGWATYVEWNSYRFTKNKNERELQVRKLLSQLTAVAYCKWDIAINYDGMSREEFKKDVIKQYGEGTVKDENIEEMYNIFIETPSNYLQYNISGFCFEDLYTKAKNELKDKFDEVKFHEVVLDSGMVGMELVEKRVNQYIEDNR